MKDDVNQYKVEWSYMNDDNKRVYEYDLFIRCSAADVVRDVREEYQDFVDFRIEDVWKDGGYSWDHIDRDCWDSYDL